MRILRSIVSTILLSLSLSASVLANYKSDALGIEAVESKLANIEKESAEVSASNMFDGYWAGKQLRSSTVVGTESLPACATREDGMNFLVERSKFQTKISAKSLITSSIDMHGRFVTHILPVINGIEYRYTMTGQLRKNKGKGTESWEYASTGEKICAGLIGYKKRELRQYDHNYENLILGESSYEDVKSYAAENFAHKKNNTYTLSLSVEASFTEERKLNSIVIKDEAYVDDNGFSIGADKSDILSLDGIGEYCFTRSCLDEFAGIIYWFDQSEKVNKIVLVSTALLN